MVVCMWGGNRPISWIQFFLTDVKQKSSKHCCCYSTQIFKFFIYMIKLITFLPNLIWKNSPKSSQTKRQLISFEKYMTHTEASKSQSSLYSNLTKKKPNKFTFVAVVVQDSYTWQFFEVAWISRCTTVYAKENK